VTPPEHAKVLAMIAKEAPKAPTRSALRSRDVFEAWRSEGPLVHEPTGLATLDELTDGGPVYGSRWVVLGAPDAGKTALLVQLAHTWLRAGVTVGMLAVDEEPSDLLGRFMQRAGFSRRECERRESHHLADMQERAGELEQLRMYTADWTIEAAAADLAKLPGPRRALLVDSLQTVSCDAEVSAGSLREAVTARVQALRAAATRYRLITVATSEMARGAYRTAEAAELSNDLASAKESGAIEYSARVMLALRSVPDEADILELRLAKNKHGPRGDRIGLRIDRRLQELSEAGLPTEADQIADREAAKVSAAHRRHIAAAAIAAAVLASSPGLPRREVRPAMKARLGSCSDAIADTALALLGPALVVRQLPGRSHRQALYLNGAELPQEIVAELGDDRPRALSARPPMEVVS